MGKSAYEFVDFLKASGQKYWQLLPLCPTEHGDSPYSSPSSFAGNPYFIDLELLVDEGLLEPADVENVDWGEDREKVDYKKIFDSRFDVLRKAFSNGRNRLATDISIFCGENSSWLDSYALYMAVKKSLDGIPWYRWPEDIRRRDAGAVEKWREKLSEEVEFWSFIQFLFFRQWNSLREYASEKGIKFIGDMPIYVAMDSADVWSEPWFFLLDGDGNAKEVAGCPPDAFTDEGQLWGNPIYDWDRMKADGYGWWIRRVEGASKLYDVIRIDHFRGFESYWAVPSGEKTAKNGSWRQGPGMALVGVLTSWFNGLQFIAEDLGAYTPGLEQLLKESGLPGMKVLEFAFDSKSESTYLPHSCNANSCCYIGTHDNDTVLGWVESLSEEDREFAENYMRITEEEGWCYGMIKTGMSTASNLFIMQMPDVLQKGGECRINVPGVALGNWRWRMKPGELTGELSERLFKMTKVYRRIR